MSNTPSPQRIALQAAVEIIGGQAETARQLGLKHRSNVHQWLKDGLPAIHAVDIHEAALKAAVKKKIPLADVPSTEALLERGSQRRHEAA